MWGFHKQRLAFLDDPAIPLLEIYLEDIQVKIKQIRHLHIGFYCGFGYGSPGATSVGKARETGIVSAIKKEQSHAICRKMDAIWDNCIK